MDFKSWLLMNENVAMACTTKECAKFNELLLDVNKFLRLNNHERPLRNLTMIISKTFPLSRDGVLQSYISSPPSKSPSLQMSNAIRHNYSNYDAVWEDIQKAHDSGAIDRCLHLDLYDELATAVSSLMTYVAELAVIDSPRHGISKQEVIGFTSNFYQHKAERRRANTALKFGTRIPCVPGRAIDKMKEELLNPEKLVMGLRARRI